MVKAHFLTDSLLTKHRTDSVGVIARAEARGDPVKLVASSTGLPRRLPSARNDIVVPSIPNRADKARPPPPRANCYILLFFHLSILSFCCVGLASPTYFVIRHRSIGHYGNRTSLFFFHSAITTHCPIALFTYCHLLYVRFFSLVKTKRYR